MRGNDLTHASRDSAHSGLTKQLGYFNDTIITIKQNSNVVKLNQIINYNFTDSVAGHSHNRYIRTETLSE